MLLRATLLWAAIIPLAVANGILREQVLRRFLAAPSARAASGVLLASVILGFALLTVPWLRAGSLAAHVGVGLYWGALTIGFEFGFGRWVAGKSWPELLRPYRFAEGDLWVLVLLVVAAAPAIAAKLRGAI